ncbi:hypothetical protein KKA95_04590 [Patescibacteria group bacterium]|nr:hypothetical protein [Patescibacteria group bacterium]MBU1934488.1 hypothetical protein [Patescibacteria group bacterium]
MPSEVEREKDALFDTIVDIIVSDESNKAKKERISVIVELMLVAFRSRLNQGILGGLIRNGEVWEERLDKFVGIYECIPASERAKITDILRGAMKEKIESDKESI